MCTALLWVGKGDFVSESEKLFPVVLLVFLIISCQITPLHTFLPFACIVLQILFQPPPYSLQDIAACIWAGLCSRSKVFARMNISAKKYCECSLECNRPTRVTGVNPPAVPAQLLFAVKCISYSASNMRRKPLHE